MSGGMSPVPDLDRKAAAVEIAPSINTSMKARKTRVLVLGAGMSGLACARELRQRGYRVLVVEARDRPGGRLKGGVKTNDREGGSEGMKTLPNSIISPDNNSNGTDWKPASRKYTTPVDLGGALIHGIDSNPIYALTQQMGIPTLAVSECLLFDASGWPVDTKEDERISSLFNQCLEETFDRVAKVASMNQVTETPAESVLAADSKETDLMDRVPTRTDQVAVSAAKDSVESEAIILSLAEEIAAVAPAAGSEIQSSNNSPDKEGTVETQNEQLDEKDQQQAAAFSDDGQHQEVSEEKNGTGVSSRQNGQGRTIRSIREAGTVVEEKKEAGLTSRQNGNTGASLHSATRNTFTGQKQKGRRSSSPVLFSTKTNESAAADFQTKTPESFGDVFDRVCQEKGAPRASPLFQWHQANLEVSCGASFPDLGYKWNDDEPYGYDGDHVAIKTSWKPVMECMAEGIDVLYQSPVNKVVLAVPDPPPKPPQESEPTFLPASTHSHEQAVASSGSIPKTSDLSPKKKRKRKPILTPLPERKSRRLLGDNPNARRSSRANKGQKVERFLVDEFSSGTYQGRASPWKQQSTGKRPHEPEEVDVHTTVQVTLEDGMVLEAEAVVCTLPLGILKLEEKPQAKAKSAARTENIEDPDEDRLGESSGAITFYPPLSERKQTAIRRLGCGLLNKCVLSFSHVFWQDSDFLGLAHIANSYLVLNAARFTNKPILTFMYGGAFAKQIESWKDNEIVGDCLEVIRIICGRRDIPTPLDYAVTRWGHERYSRMSFSYVPPGVDGMEEYKAMSEAVYDPLVPKKPVIMFAGEHTTPFHPSTMHGAFLSGVREAYRLDLVVEAEANGNLEFDDEHVYQHTFAVRRLFPSAKSAVTRVPSQPTPGTEITQSSDGAAVSAKTDPKRQHRRRGAASVMNLRQRPDTTISDTTGAATTMKKRKLQQDQESSPRGTGQNGSFSPARRSRRSVYSMAEDNGHTLQGGGVVSVLKKAPTTETEAELQRRKQIASLESRTLIRALESYGHNYSYIGSLVLPIFGSGVAQKSVPQVRARCQQLIRSIVSSSSESIPKRVLASWIPKEIYVPPLPIPLRKKRGEAFSGRQVRNNPKPAMTGTRHSSRKQKHRQLMDL